VALVSTIDFKSKGHPNRPMSLADEEQIQEPSYVIAGE
jgi:hypothetical protein